MLRCKHFTGLIIGKCAAGISYESVKDQNRTNEMPRYPCRPDDEAFTTCDQFELNQQLKRVAALVGRGVTVQTSRTAPKQYARLLAISVDGRTAYVLSARGKQTSVPVDYVHQFRNK